MKKMKANARRMLALIMAMAMCLSLMQGVALAAVSESDAGVIAVQEDVPTNTNTTPTNTTPTNTDQGSHATTLKLTDENDPSKGYTVTYTAEGRTVTEVKKWSDEPSSFVTLKAGIDEDRKATVGQNGTKTYIVTLKGNEQTAGVSYTELIPAKSLADAEFENQWKAERTYEEKKGNDTWIRQGQSLKTQVYNEEGKLVDAYFYRLRETKDAASFKDSGWVYAKADDEFGGGNWVAVNVYGTTEAFVDAADNTKTAKAVVDPDAIKNGDICTLKQTDVAANWTASFKDFENVNEAGVKDEQNPTIALVDRKKTGSFKVQLEDVNNKVFANEWQIWELVRSMNADGVIAYVDDVQGNWWTVNVIPDTRVFVELPEVPYEEGNTCYYNVWKYNTRTHACYVGQEVGLIDTGKAGETRIPVSEAIRWTKGVDDIENLEVWVREYLGDQFVQVGNNWYVIPHNAKVYYKTGTKIAKGTKTYGELEVLEVPQYFDRAVMYGRDGTPICQHEGNENVARYMSAEHLYYSETNLDCRGDRPVKVKKIVLNKKIDGKDNKGVTNYDEAGKKYDLNAKEDQVWETTTANVAANKNHTAVNTLNVDLLDCVTTDGKITVTNQCFFCKTPFKSLSSDIKFTAPLMVGNMGQMKLEEVTSEKNNPDWTYVVPAETQKWYEEENKALAEQLEKTTLLFNDNKGFAGTVECKGSGEALARVVNYEKGQWSVWYDWEYDLAGMPGELSWDAEFHHYIKEAVIDESSIVKPTKYAEGSYNVDYYCNLGHKHITETKTYTMDDLVHSGLYEKFTWGEQNPDQVRNPAALFGYLPIFRDFEVDHVGMYFELNSKVDPRLSDFSELIVDGNDARLWRADGESIYRNDFAAFGAIRGDEHGAAQGDYTMALRVSNIVKPAAECKNGSADVDVYVYRTSDESATTEANRDLGVKATKDDYEQGIITKGGKEYIVVAGEDGFVAYPIITKQHMDYVIPAEKTHNYRTVTVTNEDGTKYTIDKCTICGDTDESTKLDVPTPVDLISIAGAVVTVDSSVENGTNQQPTGVVVKLGDKTLVKGVDFVVMDLTGAKAAGTYDVTVAGIGAYTGTATGKFVIEPKKDEPQPEPEQKIDISGATVYGSAPYRGEQFPVPFTVTLNGKKLIFNVDYVISSTRTNVFRAVGKHKIQITGIGQYTGSADGYVEITETTQDVTVSPTKKTVKYSTVKKKAVSYNLTVSGAKGKVSYSTSTSKISVNSKGKVTVKKGTKKGTYKITVNVAKKGGWKAAKKTVKVVVK